MPTMFKLRWDIKFQPDSCLENIPEFKTSLSHQPSPNSTPSFELYAWLHTFNIFSIIIFLTRKEFKDNLCKKILNKTTTSNMT